MKILSGKRLWLATGCFGLVSLVGPVFADDSTISTPPAPPLPYGAADIIQLSQAQVSDGTIVTYIRNSGDSYGLDASQIVYLRQQGVSDAVVDAMLTQPKSGSTTTAPAPVMADYPPLPPPPPDALASAPAAPAPAVAAPPASSVSVYVIPDTSTYNYCANYYNGGVIGYSPVVYIGGGGWVGSRGGWHGGGGWHSSGGWHH
jgi:hypothetical protein